MLYDAWKSRTSPVLTVTSFQRLKMKALIPVPADCEMQSVIKFLNAQSITPNEIHRQLLQVNGSHGSTSTHILQEFGWEVFYHHPPYSPDLAPSAFHHFLHVKKLLSGQRQRFQNDREAEMNVTVVPIPCGRVLDTE